METFAGWLVGIVQGVGPLGIFAAMFLGNALIPIPVEVIMIPAGYLVEQGRMDLGTLLFCAIGGDVCGSLFSYAVAYHFGRRMLVRYGKHLFFGEARMQMLDRFFASHGEISTLTGRLVPGLRHFMAFPAGLSHMNIRKFALYTAIGGGVWTGILILVGYLIGNNKELVRHNLPYIEGVMVGAVLVLIVVYVQRHRRNLMKVIDGKS